MQKAEWRGIGWEFVHVCADDHLPLGVSQVLASERKEDAVVFPSAAVARYRKLGIRADCVTIESVLRIAGKNRVHVTVRAAKAAPAETRAEGLTKPRPPARITPNRPRTRAAHAGSTGPRH